MEIDRLIAETSEGRFAVPADATDRPAVRAVLDGGVHEPHTRAFIAQWVGEGDVVHAGTFFGDYLPFLERATAPGARIWAFEANPNSAALAHETVTLNQLEKITLTHCGLSDVTGSLWFRTHTPEGANLGGLAHVVDRPGPGTVEVRADLLDHLVDRTRTVSILHLDIEGHEAAALIGAFHLIRRNKPIIIAERFRRADLLDRLFPYIAYRSVAELDGDQNVVHVPAAHPLAGNR